MLGDFSDLPWREDSSLDICWQWVMLNIELKFLVLSGRAKLSAVFTILVLEGCIRTAEHSTEYSKVHHTS